jgi:geranylgeranyl diphosphate synthase type II
MKRKRSTTKKKDKARLEEPRPEEQKEQEPKTSSKRTISMDQVDKLKDFNETTANIVQRAASILEEEIAADIVAVKQVEKRFIKVSELHSGKPEQIIQRFRRYSHALVDILLGKFDFVEAILDSYMNATMKALLALLPQRFRRDRHEPVDILLDKYDFIEAILDSYKNVTMKALLALLPRKEPGLHLYNLIPSYPKRAGKGFRPGLCIATCRAFGGNIQSVLRSAVAIEMFHNAFLIHDDIEDGSEYRRGKPTLHTKNGIGIAMNVGDAMNVLSISTLMDNIISLGPRLTWQIFSEIEHMARQSVEGQAMELGWVRDNICDLSTEDYLRMTLKKTCWYTCIHPCRIGALIGTRGNINLERFNHFGYYMGAAFQIQDDILNLVGNRKTYGKEIGGDIWEGKRTMMLIHAINSCTEDEKERMRLFLSMPRKQRLRKDVRWVYQLISKYDSIEFSRNSARQLADGALREFSVAYGGLPESDDKLFIENIVLYMIEREL